MDLLSALLFELVVIAILFEVARRIGVPYPSLFVLGGVGLGFIPGIPHITLNPDLVLLVFLPPLLFAAAFETPLRDLRRNLAPVARLSIGLVVFTAVAVAAVAQAIVPTLGWPAALTLGAIVAPTDALAATSVFRRIGVPRLILTIIEGEALFNDATALIAYRSAVIATLSGAFVLASALTGFAVTAVGGIAIGYLVGRASVEVLRRLDDPPVEVVISLLIPFAAYLPAERAGLSGVLAVVTTGFIVGRRLGIVLSPTSRTMWFTTWKMVGFVLNGFAFVLIGLKLPDILAGLANRPPLEVLGVTAAVCTVALVARFLWVYASGLLPGSPRRRVARRNPGLAWRLTFLAGWAGLRGAVSLAAALALPASFPEHDLILLITFAVILVTLVGQGLTLPIVARWTAWDAVEEEGEGEAEFARATMYQVGLDAIRGIRPRWPGHEPLLNRLESSLQDRSQHLATQDPTETAERRQERMEHEEIQMTVINAQRAAITELRDAGEINDATLRTIERELDLEELRMEA